MFFAWHGVALQVENDSNFLFLVEYLSQFTGDLPTEKEVEDCFLLSMLFRRLACEIEIN